MEGFVRSFTPKPYSEQLAFMEKVEAFYDRVAVQHNVSKTHWEH